jgi:hypothetical protein
MAKYQARETLKRVATGAASSSSAHSQKAHNQHLKGWDETKFVKFRGERDRSLPLPNLMLSALRVVDQRPWSSPGVGALELAPR